MKKSEAIIRPLKLEDVKVSLGPMPRIVRDTVSRSAAGSAGPEGTVEALSGCGIHR